MRTAENIDRTARRTKLVRRVLTGAYVTSGGVIGKVLLADLPALASWLAAHPLVAVLLFLAYPFVPLGITELVDGVLRRRRGRLDPPKLLLAAPDDGDPSSQFPAPGSPGRLEHTLLLRAAYALLFDRCPAKLKQALKLRLTLFAPSQSAGGRLQQLARFRWDAATEVSSTLVRIGTCAAGNAWNRRMPYQLLVSAKQGFILSLRRCGVTEDEARAHNLKDRKLFCAVPVFADGDGQTPYEVDGAHEVQPVAVLVADAAQAGIPRDWHSTLAKFVFPALAASLVSRGAKTVAA